MYIVTFEPQGVSNVLIKGRDLSVDDFCDKVANSVKEQEPAALWLPEVQFGQSNPSEDLH